MSWLANPELVRNARGQLRPGRVVATVVICAAVSVAIGASLWSRGGPRVGPDNWGMVLLKVTMFLQTLVLAAGGGIACLNSIHKEKEQNTFDFQRVTRLTPLELTLGKLFGAPLLSYLICVCLLPLAAFGALIGGARISLVLAGYAVLLAGSVLFHALALLTSMLTVKGSHSASILFLLVLLLGGANEGGGIGIFRLGPLSPFFAATVVEEGANALHPVAMGRIFERQDFFFGVGINHLVALLALDLIFIGWFLLALVRNIKRDPEYYELYSPLQGLGLAILLNVLLVGFFNWKGGTTLDREAQLLTFSAAVVFGLGISLLWNRARMRRILRSKARGWWEQVWPAPMVLSGALVSAAMIVWGAAGARDSDVDWSAGFAWFRALFLIAWLVRDMQYLQWASLQRGKHPLLVGILFQVIFYVCCGTLLGAMGVFRDPELEPFAAFFLPTAVGVLDHAAWAFRPAVWMAAFVAQWVVAGVFVYLQGRVMEELRGRNEEMRAAA